MPRVVIEKTRASYLFKRACTLVLETCARTFHARQCVQAKRALMNAEEMDLIKKAIRVCLEIIVEDEKIRGRPYMDARAVAAASWYVLRTHANARRLSVGSSSCRILFDDLLTSDTCFRNIKLKSLNSLIFHLSNMGDVLNSVHRSISEHKPSIVEILPEENNKINTDASFGIASVY